MDQWCTLSTTNPVALVPDLSTQNTPFLILRSGTSATGFLAERVPHFYLPCCRRSIGLLLSCLQYHYIPTNSSGLVNLVIRLHTCYHSSRSEEGKSCQLIQMHLSVLLLPVFGPTSSPMYPKFQGRTGGQFGLSGPGPHHKPKKCRLVASKRFLMA